jgi:membrane protein required for colicin V production
MNYIDIILALLLLFAAINGFKNGFVSELASLAALVLGVWGGIEFSYITTDFLINRLGIETNHLNLVSFLVTFVIIVILVHLVASSLSKLLEVAMLGWANKITGLVFGFFKTAFILSILLLVFNKIDDDVHILSPQTKSESKLYEPIRKLAPSVFPFIYTWQQKGDTQSRRNGVA